MSLDNFEGETPAWTACFLAEVAEQRADDAVELLETRAERRALNGLIPCPAPGGA